MQKREQVAATFGIPLARIDLTKRKREDNEVITSVPALPSSSSLHGNGIELLQGMVPLTNYNMPKLLDSSGSKKKVKTEPGKKDARGRSGARSV